MQIQLSLVIPMYNEEENLRPLIGKIIREMSLLGRTYECIFVDDGSTDRSRELILSEKKSHPEIRLVSFRRRFGQTAALSAGFDHARGDVIVTLDADLQNDPADIGRLLEKMEEGYDLVSGWRKERKDSFLRNIFSRSANALIAWSTGVRLHDSGCTLKAYRREVVKDMRLYGEMHRFIPAIASWQGVSIIEVPVTHHARTRGKSKYGFSRIFRVSLDLITVKFFLSYSTSPIQVFGTTGLVSCVAGVFCLFFAVALKFLENRTLTGNPLFYLFIFMEMIGIQFILIGLLGEINIRTYHESQGKKTYVVRDII